MIKKLLIIFISLLFLFSCNKNQEIIINDYTENNTNLSESNSFEEEIKENKIDIEENMIYVEWIDWVDKEYKIITNNINKELVIWLSEDLDNFNKVYEIALYNTWNENKKAVANVTDILHYWQNVVEKYLNKEVEWFLNIKNLDEKLLEIYDIINYSNSLVRDSDLLNAHNELKKIKDIISEIRK